jgi:hypothetical protein
MKRLLFLLFFTAIKPPLMVAASEVWPYKQQFKVPEQFAPAQAPAGKRLSSDTVNAGFAAISVLAGYLKDQILRLKQDISVKNYQSASFLYQELRGLYVLINAQSNGLFLLQRLGAEMGFELNDQLLAEYERSLAALKN